jgi:hypothetical protein
MPGEFQAGTQPYNPGYHVSSVPLSYDNQVQLSAVLRVIYPQVRSTPKLIIEATARVCQRWRILATKLSTAGWWPLAGPLHEKKSQLANALGCPPAFVMTAEKSYKAKARIKAKLKNTGCCHLRQVCPFCWAREVRRYWLKIEPVFFPQPKHKRKPQRVRQVDTGPSTEKSSSFTLRVKDDESIARSPYDLVYRVFTFDVPITIAHPMSGVAVVEEGVLTAVPDAIVMRDGLRTWLTSRLHGKPDAEVYRLHECRALLKAAGPGGGMLETIQYRGLTSTIDGQSWWEVQVHQLILAADGDAVPAQLHPMATGKPKMHVVLRKPNRRILAKWLAKTLRYPKFFLLPDTPLAHVIECLEARRGRRLVASYGRFRDKTLK